MVDSVSVVPQSGSDVGGFVEPEKVNGGVAEGGEILSGSAIADATVILTIRGVAYPVKAVFDVPMLSPPFEKLSGVSVIARHTGDGVLCFDSLFAVAQRAAC